LSDKETNQRNRSLAGGFFVRSGLFLFNCVAGEFALRQTQSVSVAVAVGLRFSERASGSELKSNGGESKASMDYSFVYFSELSTRQLRRGDRSRKTDGV